MIQAEHERRKKERAIKMTTNMEEIKNESEGSQASPEQNLRLIMEEQEQRMVKA
jgi:hypothetical protein